MGVAGVPEERAGGPAGRRQPGRGWPCSCGPRWCRARLSQVWARGLRAAGSAPLGAQLPTPTAPRYEPELLPKLQGRQPGAVQARGVPLHRPGVCVQHGARHRESRAGGRTRGEPPRASHMPAPAAGLEEFGPSFSPLNATPLELSVGHSGVTEFTGTAGRAQGWLVGDGIRRGPTPWTPAYQADSLGHSGPEVIGLDFKGKP